MGALTSSPGVNLLSMSVRPAPPVLIRRGASGRSHRHMRTKLILAAARLIRAGPISAHALFPVRRTIDTFDVQGWATLKVINGRTDVTEFHVEVFEVTPGHHRELLWSRQIRPEHGSSSDYAQRTAAPLLRDPFRRASLSMVPARIACPLMIRAPQCRPPGRACRTTRDEHR